jgi:hypothetical protein
MRRFDIPLSIVGLVFIGVVGFGVEPDILAQEATPAGETGAEEGVSFELFALAPVQTLPPAPASIILGRDRIEPGALHVVAPDLGLGLIYAETGTTIVRVEAAVVVTRAGSGGEPGPQEEIAADTEFTFGPGDSFVWPPNVGGEARNEGTEPATAIVSIIYPDEPATPTP